MRGPKPLPITPTAKQRDILIAITRRQKSEQRLVRRATIILLAEQEYRNAHISEKLGVGRQSIRTWRKRWHDIQSDLNSIEEEVFRRFQGEEVDSVALHKAEKEYAELIEGVLSDEQRAGRPSEFTAEQIVQLVALACKDPKLFERPVSHWTPTELQDEAIKQGIFKSISVRSVGRFLKRSKSKASPDSILAQFT